MLLCVSATFAQNVTISKVVALIGENTVVTVESEGCDTWSGFNCDVAIPAGFEFVEELNEDDEMALAFEKGTALKTNHAISATYHKEGNWVKVVVFEPSKKTLKSTGSLFTFKIKPLSETAEGTVGKIEVSNFKSNTGDTIEPFSADLVAATPVETVAADAAPQARKVAKDGKIVIVDGDSEVTVGAIKTK